MDDKTHIGLINAHAKGHSSHNDLDLIAVEGLLVGLALLTA